MPAYIGYENGKAILYFAESLNPFGTRLQKGTKFPNAVYDLYEKEQTPEVIISALKSANAYLNGEEAGSEKLTFGESVTKTRKKRTI